MTTAETYFSQECEKIAQRYSFKPGFNLAEALHPSEIYQDHRMVYAKKLRPKKRKKIFTKIVKKAKEMEALIDEADDMSTHLSLALEMKLKGGLSLYEIKSHLNKTRELLSEHVDNMEKDRGGRNPKDIRKAWINILINIFKKGTGRKASLTYDPHDEEMPYKGDFFNFLIDCLELYGHKDTAHAIGAHAHKILKERRKFFRESEITTKS